jgi:hypothetical protein
MKPAFANLEIEFWVHRGKLGTTQPSLCLFHSSVQTGSIQTGVQILDALNELKNDALAQRKLTFVNCSRERPLSYLRLKLVPGREDLKVMRIAHEADAATIEMTNEGLSLLVNACTAWLAGFEDFGVSPRHSSLTSKELGKLDQVSGELWFWGPGYDGP